MNDYENTGAATQGAPGKPFVLLSAGRSGTNFLISKLLLTQHVLFGWEPFNKPMFGYGGWEYFNVPKQVMARMNDEEFRNSDPEAYITYCAGLTGALDNTGAKMTGFKIFPGHNKDIYWRMTRDTRFRALVLERRSMLAAYSSLRIALETNEWVARDSKRNPAPKADRPAAERKQVKVQFYPENFKRFSAGRRELFAHTVKNLERAGVDYLHFVYEDLVSDPDIFSSILKLLEIEAPPVGETWLKKQNDPNVLNRFTNPEAVLPFLEQEQHEASAEKRDYPA